MKIIVGAGEVKRDGWLSLQFSDLDIRARNSWLNLFKPNSIDAIVTEHTLEHLTENEARAAVSNFYEFLKPGGYVRCAVPDGFHPNPNYHEWVDPESKGEKFLAMFRGDGEPNHKTLWNYRTLSNLFINARYDVQLLEFFDEKGIFHQLPIFDNDGFIRRRKNTAQSILLSLISNSDYTSLIIDAFKV